MAKKSRKQERPEPEEEEQILIDEELLESRAIEIVQLDALVLMKILKHCEQNSVANGQLLGLDILEKLQVTHSIPYPASLKSSAEGESEEELGTSNYPHEMMNALNYLDYETNIIGWYQSTLNGFVSLTDTLVKTQYDHQTQYAQAVHLIVNPSKTAGGHPVVTAIRLTDDFMKLYESKNFSLKNINKHNISASTVFETLPIQIKNSNVLNAMFRQLSEVIPSTNVDDLIVDPLTHVVNNPSSEFYLEKQLEYLTEAVEDQGQEHWRWHTWYRGFHKEQQKAIALSAKMAQENAAAVAAGKKPVYSEEELVPNTPALAKAIASEPPRLDNLLNHTLIDAYCNQIINYAGSNPVETAAE
ncbi:Eukaryotic translation initiation factor 3 subunit H [Boothiomyces macroporosus]|uniref:Eukaryotic translation initiation factor 3 subunit H n=1 Tax=Boothiomyces macroporosus TaxID=261099 RepID=A0AAD5UFY6_9FUNG|nr:Eukaryotic translation initiation factor 3 subunit H [Boothiomyces macroporosus]